MRPPIVMRPVGQLPLLPTGSRSVWARLHKPIYQGNGNGTSEVCGLSRHYRQGLYMRLAFAGPSRSLAPEIG